MASIPAPSSPRARRYDLAVFDLDGTLADSFGFFIANHNRLAQRHRFAAIAEHEVEMLRGWSPRQIMRHTRLPAWRLPLVARDFRRLMRDEGQAITCFPGAREALHQLHALGMRLAMVTSNSAENSRRILGEDCWTLLAHVECGASLFGKARRLRRVLARTGVPASRAIYVGDQASDAEAARQAGMAFAAVAWGYATADSLQACQPQAYLAEVSELRRLAGD
ncbi:HAD hydrolase-like protein [Pseudoxanthomonas suwonensis]|uniref:HAD hydrolase-like protein n=1 Tax=Pseudoxanthomonas suwonensis TaxID=314722 RepID=UPI00138F34FE|nr:HAD hydrolase-like protein [Pseudoxanthomonas suwonensis]KAF1702498.1 haloacid dehalogenase [Pseudoxanthomonas suwonensis]